MPNGRSKHSSRVRSTLLIFIIKFEVLAIKAEIDNLYAIFLLKKNFQTDIIKIITGIIYGG